MAWLKRLLNSIQETRQPYYKSSTASPKTIYPQTTESLALDAEEERSKEKPHSFADNYRKYFPVEPDDLFLLKDYSVDRHSDPDKELEYYDFYSPFIGWDVCRPISGAGCRTIRPSFTELSNILEIRRQQPQTLTSRFSLT